MIQVSTLPRFWKSFTKNSSVNFINPIADTVATATYQGADADWYIKADDTVDKGF